MPIKSTQKADKKLPYSRFLLGLFGTLLYTHATLFEPLTYSRVVLLSLDYGTHKEKKEYSQQQLTKHSNGVWMDQVTR